MMMGDGSMIIRPVAFERPCLPREPTRYPTWLMRFLSFDALYLCNAQDSVVATKASSSATENYISISCARRPVSCFQFVGHPVFALVRRSSTFRCPFVLCTKLTVCHSPQGAFGQHTPR